MERRKLPRPKLDTLLKVDDGDRTYFGQTIDISLSGISCELTINFEGSQPLLLSFRLDAKDKPITTWAAPVWSIKSTGGKFRLGMQFLDLDSSHYAKIADFVADNWINAHNLH